MFCLSLEEREKKRKIWGRKNVKKCQIKKPEIIFFLEFELFECEDKNFALKKNKNQTYIYISFITKLSKMSHYWLILSPFPEGFWRPTLVPHHDLFINILCKFFTFLLGIQTLPYFIWGQKKRTSLFALSSSYTKKNNL